jgi:hypothetical protein
MAMALLVKPVPEASPLQLVKTYCMPVVPATVPASRVAFAEVPLLYQSAPVAMPWSEVTVNRYWVLYVMVTGVTLEASPDDDEATYRVPVAPDI